ncbi:prephenate dehydratase [Selenomonas sp. TAMA-11512]|uniref:prephenate dehydratase n=1 Tax=Selenomonas sp. TAMA-11512 TaxID=3095337 RepID=UPI003088FDB3|nr:prephenate dehydratase [Selenomonas sp. TAMA-11512]
MAKLAFLGPVGTHSEAAAMHLAKLRGLDDALCPYPDIFQVLEAVDRGDVDRALVPVENSMEGAVNITLDALIKEQNLTVTAELIWGVHNQLMAKPGHGEIRKVLSHVQPLSQCREYLSKHYPKAALVATASTSEAAREVGHSDVAEGLAAICTRRAGELNDLVIVDEEIQDSAANCTRFFEVRQKGVIFEPLPKNAPEKILLICLIDGKRAGSLCDVLMEFSKRDINMTHIESRPTRMELGTYIFFFDIEPGDDERLLQETIDSVEKKSIWLRVIGRFPVISEDSGKG